MNAGRIETKTGHATARFYGVIGKSTLVAIPPSITRSLARQHLSLLDSQNPDLLIWSMHYGRQPLIRPVPFLTGINTTTPSLVASL
ncbi:hypothetical protein ONZ45_g10841 [Pleurotus djamor]|nr:hypothetical protein ONZ45_g10841 [Pleurotus djamor]